MPKTIVSEVPLSRIAAGDLACRSLVSRARKSHGELSRCEQKAVFNKCHDIVREVRRRAA